MSAAPHQTRPLQTAWAGMLCLAVAMGIGRFAFTPLLPMMLHDGVIGLDEASWLASANYLGYALGAVACALQPWLWQRMRGWPPLAPTRAIRFGLIATVLLTLGMALPWPAAWPLWRGLAGLASAMVFVFTSSWCLAQLVARAAPQLGGLIYVGPGLGIALSGLATLVLVACGAGHQIGWTVLGVLALCMTLVLWPHLKEGALPPAATGAAPVAAPAQPGGALLILAYGLAGFGYIITATFLPVLARQALPGSIWLDLFWPLFGLGVGLGALLTLRVPVAWDRRVLLLVCYLTQGLGVVTSLYLPSLFGFALSSLLVGLPFTAITLFAMQEARRLRPLGAATFIAWLTASYGVGQIAGPFWVAYVLRHSPDTAQGFAQALWTACAALCLGVLLYALLIWRHPRAAPKP